MSEMFFRLFVTSFNPMDGNPSELTIDYVAGFLAIRGFGLPGCGFSSTVPPTMYPNPILERDLIETQSLSYPAASPTGLSIYTFPMWVFKALSLKDKKKLNISHKTPTLNRTLAKL